MKNEQQFFKITAHSIEFEGLSHEFTYKRGARNYEEQKSIQFTMFMEVNKLFQTFLIHFHAHE